jgi:hypothetical protein
MGKKAIPVPVAVTLIGIVVVLVGMFLYRGMSGGTVGDGRAGNVEASPPMPEAAKQQMIQTARQQRGGQ